LFSFFLSLALCQNPEKNKKIPLMALALQIVSEIFFEWVMLGHSFS